MLYIWQEDYEEMLGYKNKKSRYNLKNDYSDFTRKKHQIKYMMSKSRLEIFPANQPTF